MDSLPEDSRVTKPRPPEPVAGDYILERKLGGGAFGTVFQARHKRTGFRYAVKRLHLSGEDAERFEKEALYPASIASHSMHVVNVIEFFGSVEDGTFYLVTELVPHGDLRQFLETQPSPLPVPLALQIVIGIAKGLTAIHAQGVIHRDLKPGNVLMDRKDENWIPKIADFGLARSAGSLSMGDFASPGYAAPEQLEYGVPGPHSDIFGFGMMVFEIMTGRRVTDAADLRAYNEFLKARPAIPKLSDVRPELASIPELDALVRELLRFDPGARTLTAPECVTRLAAIERRLSGHRETSPETCRKCGAALEKGDTSCRVCGTSVNETDRPIQPETPVESAESWPERIKTVATIAAVMAIVLLPSTLGGVGWSGRYSIVAVLVGITFSSGLCLHGKYSIAALQAVAGGLLGFGYKVITDLAPSGWVSPAVFLLGAAVLIVALYIVVAGIPATGRTWIAIALSATLITVVGAASLVLLFRMIDTLGSRRFDWALNTTFHLWFVAIATVILTIASDAPRSLFVHRGRFAAAFALTFVVAAAATAWSRAEHNRPKIHVSQTNEISGQAYYWIPAGEFVMGCSENDTACQPDELPSHRVRITKPFWLTTTEVTVDAWRKVMVTMPPEAKWAGGELNPGWSDGDQPIVMVTWSQASDYCSKIGGRLPTEAEWEYAARAGSKLARYGPIGDIARDMENSGDVAMRSEDLRTLAEEEQFRQLAANHARPARAFWGNSNEWDLHGMLGNVSEWVADDYAPDLYSTRSGTTVDPNYYGSSNAKVIRGGDFLSPPTLVRASSRLSAPPDSSYITVGFRCVWNKPD